MSSKNGLRLLALCLCAYASLLLGRESRAEDRDSQLQASFLHFPFLTPVTNSEGRPEFQVLALTNPVVIDDTKYFGFRFKAPRRKHSEDFVWAMVMPAGYMEWYILPETGAMQGFTEYHTATKADYMGTNSLFPLAANKMFVQNLPGAWLEDDTNYLVWFTLSNHTKKVSVTFTFARPGTNTTNKFGPNEKALNLNLPSSAPVVNPANHHTYILLRANTWQKSEAQAVALGGHLATVRNQAEEDWLMKTFGSYGGSRRLLWIGLSDRDKKFHFTWSSGESMSYTCWAKGEPNNAGRGEDFVAIYYPGHSQAGKWNDWSDRTHDPIGLPINGVAEIIPPGNSTNVLASTADTASTGNSNAAALAPASITSGNAADVLQAVQITPSLIITNDSGAIKLEWAISLSNYMLEATTNLAGPYTMFGYSELTNEEAGFVYVTITNPVPQMFFRLRKP